MRLRWSFASRIILAVGLLVSCLTSSTQGANTAITGSILKGYVTGTIHSESAAVAQALAVMGLDSASATAKASQRILTKPPGIPFLYEQLKGKEVWSVALGGVGLSLLSASGEVEEHGHRDFHVLLDSSTGKVLSITSTSSIEVPDLRPRPSVERAEEFLGGERYESFPDEPPGITFLEALGVIWRVTGGNPLMAKDIDALYVIQSSPSKAASPVWIITLRGVTPMYAPLPRGGEEPPVWMRNCVRNVVDARTGQHLFDANAPYPRAIVVALIKGEEQEPFISYFTTSTIFPDQLRPKIQAVVAVWRDGHILWSEDKFHGGPPYYESHLEKGSISTLLDKIEKEDLFNQKDINQFYCVPNMEASSMVITDGSRLLSMTSIHELAEMNPEILATSQGIVDMAGRTEDEIRAEEKDENYLRFRAIWDEVREDLLSLIPATKGTPLGDVEFEKRMVTVDKQER